MIDLNPAFYSKPNAEIWTGRNDGDELSLQRWHQRIIPVDLLSQDITMPVKGHKGIALIGFACDEGVKRNGGRTGAKNGPDHFRKTSCNLPVQFEEDLIFIDLGNIICENGDMEQAQQSLAKVVSHSLKTGYQPLVIGGGHEVAYAHYTGISSHLEKTDTIGIINFDAHFDLREPGLKGPNSGTGFLQISEDCKITGRPFHYLPIGIQRNSNTRQLFETATGLGVNYILSDLVQPLQQQKLSRQIEEFITSCSHIYLTICLDVFSSSVAPGVSAPAYSGLFPDPFFFSILHQIIASDKVISMDIAELNPEFDADQRTAKLAAALAFSMVSK